ncbi:MAG: DUF1592 domain-containing protein [Mariniblastus sp.]|nr:DUF1592 domain-containing protein [Mariniblastus sp.]
MQKRLMSWVSNAVLASSVACLGIIVSPTNAEDPDAFSKIIQPAIKKHCASCHGAKTEIEGDANLMSLKPANFEERVELIRSLIDVLELEEMPPQDEPPLQPELRRQLVTQLRMILQKTVAKKSSFAQAPIRRMNRFQYNNAVVDLLELKCIVFTLPERMMRDHKRYFKPETGKMADVVTVGSRPLGKSQMIETRLAGVAAFPQDLRAEHGFDNRGDHLSLSPLLMESFLELGQSITQSPDFSPRYVGIWKRFFAEPNQEILTNDTKLKHELTSRLRPFLSKAFRRPVEASVLNRYTSFALKGINAGDTFLDVMRSITAATIASPKFLYLYDKSTKSGKAEPIDDFELASRLSFFLWGSIPDETLLEVATSGKLRQPETLAQQVDRMLKDQKLKRFCDSFPSQWLQLERIISAVPDPKKFPKFYFLKYRNSMHMMLEPLLLFETVLIENQPITQLIDPDFTYRSKRLDDAYGDLSARANKNQNGGAVGVLSFHRVPVADRRTGGVITNAAVMTMTSGPERSKPITRGAWVAGVIFNDPPEPPPADVPELNEKPPQEEANLTLRERLNMHRERADCRGCHEQIDPLGFALENYDAIGKWRDRYENGRKVDMAGSLFRKHEFSSVTEFKDAILKEKDRFARGFAGHLLSFALARDLAAADQPTLDNIIKTTSAGGHRMQSLIKQIVLSEPFLSKSNSTTPSD